MTSIIEDVRVAYLSISSLMEKLNDSTVCFVSELKPNLQNRPKIKIFEGFVEISENFSISTPKDGNCELSLGEGGEIVFETTPIDWIAISLSVDPHVEFRSAIAEVETTANAILHTDLQLRTFYDEGSYSEGPLKTWTVPPQTLATASSPSDGRDEDTGEGRVEKRSVVLHFRTPPTSFALKSMRFFLI